MEDLDLKLARQLQEEFDRESASTFTSPGASSKVTTSSKSPLSIVDAHWELTDPNPDIRALFLQYNERFFWGKLAGIEVKWSPRMTLCAGLCVYEGHGGLCSVRLSTPLLKLRPRKDLVETLLHEMIHAYLFVTQNNKDHDGHGPEFQKHMNRINKETGTNISIYHNFHDEVALYQQHWWRCDGPCRQRPPYFGYVKRAMNRAPAPRDPWWGDHQRTCGGTYTKVKEPEGYGQKKGKKDKDKEERSTGKPQNSGPDIRSFWGQGQTSGSKVTSVKKPPTSTVTSGHISSAMDEPQLPTLPTSQVKAGAIGSSSKGNINSSSVFPSDNKHSSVTVPPNYTSASHDDPSRRPSATGISRPGGKPVIKTIWDDGTNKETKDISKPPLSGGPQICDINSVDSFKNESSTSTFSGKGCVLGDAQGQGTSFLAQLRREMNSAKKSSTSEKTDSQRSKLPSPGKHNFEENADRVKNKVISPQKNVKNKTVSPKKEVENKTASPQKSIKEWISSDSQKKSPHSLTTESHRSDGHVEKKPSLNKYLETSQKNRSSTETSRISRESESQDVSFLSEDDDDFISPRKPLFKKVNPASNFTSPPLRRISHFSKDSPSKHSSSSSPRADHAPGELFARRSSEVSSSKRKHVARESDDDSDRKHGKRFKSWTSKPQYSTSDDSDVEEFRPLSKKFKTGSKDKFKSLNIKHPDNNKVKHKGNNRLSGESSMSNTSRNDTGNKVSNKSNNAQRDDTAGLYVPSERSGGDNSSSVTADPLHCCPVCQTRVPASQINTHLDQCLTFG